MIELLAGALVAAAALAYVVEPLVRPQAGVTPEDAPQGASAPPDPEIEALVRRFRDRLRADCPGCHRPGEPGAAFCTACGRPLFI